MDYFNDLLAKALIKRATTNSVASVMQSADRANTHSTWVLNVLRAPGGTRAAVKAQARASNLPGQKHIAAILSLYEFLSPEDKVAYLRAYTACATVTSLGTREVVYQGTWQGGHVPPHAVP